MTGFYLWRGMLIVPDRKPLTSNQQRIAQFRRAQPLEELARKAEKARRRQHIWTQEELDHSRARFEKLPPITIL